MQKTMTAPRPTQAPTHKPQPQEAAPPKPKLADSKTIVLDYPVTFAGMTTTQLNIRRLKAKDFKLLDTIPEGGNAAAIAMTALICGVDEAIIDELDAQDYLRVQEIVSDFFPSALVAKLQSKASESLPT